MPKPWWRHVGLVTFVGGLIGILGTIAYALATARRCLRPTNCHDETTLQPVLIGNTPILLSMVYEKCDCLEWERGR